MVFVPVLDVRGLSALVDLPVDTPASSIPPALAATARSVGEAFFKAGFFVAEFHDISLPILDSVETTATQFFNMDIEKKMEMAMKKSLTFRGYTVLGAEVTQGKKDLKETYAGDLNIFNIIIKKLFYY